MAERGFASWASLPLSRRCSREPPAIGCRPVLGLEKAPALPALTEGPRFALAVAELTPKLRDPEVSGRLSGDLDEQLVGDSLEDLVHELVAPGIVVWEGERFGQPGSADGQDSLAQRFPCQSLLVDVANDVPAGVALA